MNIGSIVAVTDFSAHGNHALERAAQLSATHGAPLQLMYSPPDGDPANPSAAVCLAHASRQLAQRYSLNARPIAKVANSVAHIAEEARSADLLVLAQWRYPALRAFWLGPLSERVLRRSDCPLLVIKSVPHRRYSRILVAVDLTAQASALVGVASAIEPDSGIELFHTISTQIESKLRFAHVSGDIIEAYRNDCLRRARERMERFAGSLDVPSHRISHAVGRGDPGRQAAIRQQADGAGLVVVGKRRSSRLTDLLAGSVAQSVLRSASSDVLVVPHDSRSVARPVFSRMPAAIRDDGATGFSAASGSAS